MPELPEVETVKRVLEPQITGRRIEKIDVKNSQVIARPDANEFCSALAGQTIAGMGRRGKFLKIMFKSGAAVVLHLRMTGSLLLAPRGWSEEKHTHLVFVLDDGSELRYSDVRRFGRFWLLRVGETDDFTGAQKLGFEPFDKALTAKYLQNAFAKSKRAVKDCLLDQSVIAGIGNIYSDEILFAAKIRPDRTAESLTRAEWARLARLVPERLSYFLEKNAISAEDYLAGKGEDYRNTPYLRVYGHAGEPCPVCGEPLCKTAVAGRGSVYCQRCQK
jgi:formamidopyrimidine-DNA glycosylase